MPDIQFIIWDHPLQDPINQKNGSQLLRRAHAFGSLTASKEIGPWQAGAEVRWTDSRPDIDINTFARTQIGSYTLVNASASYRLNANTRISLRADNLFDRDYEPAQGYNGIPRTVTINLEYRPR